MYTEADTEQRGCDYKSLCRRKQREYEESQDSRSCLDKHSDL